MKFKFILLSLLLSVCFIGVNAQDFGFGGKYETIQQKTASYTALTTDSLILVDATSGAVTITLPTPVGNFLVRQRVMKTDSSVNAVTITAAAGTVYGQTYITRQYETAVYDADGLAGWYQANWNGIKLLPVVVTAGATPAIDPRLGNIFTLTPAEAETITASTAGYVGQEITLIVTTSGTSSFTLTFSTNLKSTGTLATGVTSAKIFVVKFASNGTTFVETSRTAAQ